MTPTYCSHCGNQLKPDADWEFWVDGLEHPNPTTAMEALQDFAHSMIEHAGDLGPNGNVWSGVDEGEIITYDYFCSVIQKIRELPE